jgi:hypothetical protein
MRTRIVLALCTLFVLAVGVATATAGGGKSAIAMQCQKNGWMNLQGLDGTQFTSEDQCVSFGAHGGTLVPSNASVSISYAMDSTGRCFSTAHLSNFVPKTQYQVFVQLSTNGFPAGTDGPFSVTTDSSGAGSVGMISFAPFFNNAEQAFVGGISSSIDLVSC